MRPLKSFLLLAVMAAGMLFSSLNVHCSTHPSDSPEGENLLAPDNLLALQQQVIVEYRAENVRLINELRRCNGVVSVNMPNDWRGANDVYLAQYNEKAQKANEVIDSLQLVIQELADKAPAKGSSSGEWIAWVLFAISALGNVIQKFTGKKKTG